MGGPARRLEEVRAPLEENRCDRPCEHVPTRILASAGLVGRTPDPGRGADGRSGPRGPARRRDAATRLGQPVRHGAGRRLRGLRPDLRPARRLRPGQRARPRLRRHLGACRRRQVLDVPHPRGHDLVRRHPGDRRGCLLLVPDQPRRDRGRVERRPRLHRSVRRIGRRHQGRVPGRRDDDHDHERPVAPARSSCTSRSCPSTSGARRPTPRSARTRSTPRRSAPARTSWSSGRPASTSSSSATPTTGATRARPTRSSSSSSAAPTPWSRPSRPARSTTPAARTPSSSMRSRPSRTS